MTTTTESISDVSDSGVGLSGGGSIKFSSTTSDDIDLLSPLSVDDDVGTGEDARDAGERPGVLHYHRPYDYSEQVDVDDADVVKDDVRRTTSSQFGTQGRIHKHFTNISAYDSDDDTSGSGGDQADYARRKFNDASGMFGDVIARSDRDGTCRVTITHNMPHDESYPVISDDDDARTPLLSSPTRTHRVTAEAGTTATEMVRITNVSSNKLSKNCDVTHFGVFCLFTHH